MIKDIIEAFSPSGQEENLRELLKQRLKGRFDEISVDRLGNLIAKSGEGKGLCVECGMDSTGVMIVSKECNKAYFSAVGAVKPKELAGRKVVFSNGRTGEVRCDGEADVKSAKISDLYIETDTEEIKIGDFGAVISEFDEEDGAYIGYGLKERIGLAAVLEALEQSGTSGDMTVLFSAQKRLGGRGLRAFFGANSFEGIVSVDASCGNGCVIVAKDAGAVAERSLRTRLERIAGEHGIYAETVVTEDNFCLGPICVSCGDPCAAIGVSVLCREDEPQRVNKSDFDEAVKLLAVILNTGGFEKCL